MIFYRFAIVIFARCRTMMHRTGRTMIRRTGRAMIRRTGMRTVMHRTGTMPGTAMSIINNNDIRMERIQMHTFINRTSGKCYQQSKTRKKDDSHKIFPFRAKPFL